jgi:spore germination cell wall hydrolase CwlJ-like protein
MKYWIFRAGALGPAAMFVTLFYAGSSGAWAQDLATAATASPPIVIEGKPVFESAPIESSSVPQTPAEAQAAPQFFAEEVVQPTDDVREFGAEAAARYRQATSLQELVGDMPVEAALSQDLECLAQAVYFEARGEPLAGQLAVARVVINRADSGLYPADYCSVVTQRAQFSFVRNGRIPEPDENSKAWRKAMAVAQIAHQDLWESEAGDALYFHASYVKPGWASRKRQLARIDTHVFYR